VIFGATAVSSSEWDNALERLIGESTKVTLVEGEQRVCPGRQAAGSDDRIVDTTARDALLRCGG
jgi:hypothetical protein